MSKLPKWLWGHLNCSGFSRNTYHRWKTRNFQICNIINLLTTRFHQLWSPNSNNIFITHQNTSDWLSNSEKISSDQLLDLCTMYLHTYDNLRSVINISKTIQNVEESASLIFTKLKKNTYPKAVIGKSNKDSLKILLVLLKSINSNFTLAVHSPKLNQVKTHFLSHHNVSKINRFASDLWSNG